MAHAEHFLLPHRPATPGNGRLATRRAPAYAEYLLLLGLFMSWAVIWFAVLFWIV